MVAAIKQIVTVKDDGVLEIRSPELRQGATAEVIVLVEDPVADPAARIVPPAFSKMSDWFGAGQGQFKSVEEIDAYIRELRDWGDRDLDP